MFIVGTSLADESVTRDACSSLICIGEEARGKPGEIRDADRRQRGVDARAATREMGVAVAQSAETVEARWKAIWKDMERLRAADARVLEEQDKRQVWIRALQIISAAANVAGIIGQAAHIHRSAAAAVPAADIVHVGRAGVTLEIDGKDGAEYILGVYLHGAVEDGSHIADMEAYLRETLQGSKCGDWGCRSPAYVETAFDAAMLAASVRDAYEAFKPGSVASDSRRLLTATALGVDVVAAVLPGVPAIGGRSIMQIARFETTVRKKFPKNFVGKFTDKSDSLYQSGVKWTDPKSDHNWVRIMFGNPKSKYPNSRHTYVRVQRNGKALDQYGNPLPSPQAPDAHIPIEDFLEHFPEGRNTWSEINTSLRSE